VTTGNGAPSLRHRLEYALVASVAWAIRWLPWTVVDFAGRTLGVLFYTFDGAHRRVATQNLQSAFPARSAAECRAIARAVFQHFGAMLFELLKFSRLTPQQMLERVEFEGADRARQAYQAGRGVFLLTGHFGCWEVNGLVHALHLQPIGVMARALDNPYLNDMLERVREGTGNKVIYRKGGIRRTLRTLEAGQGVAILIDQHIHGPDAVRVDFFNRPAATTTALAALAARTGAQVLPVFAIPNGPGRYRIIYEHAVQPPAGESPEALHDFTQRCTDVLEMYVRRYPDLWLWMHRRWRDAENGVEEKGMFPTASPDVDHENGVVS
jgi:Kdo2-lipid IVA lauroyltransferase/acyltransferase